MLYDISRIIPDLSDMPLLEWLIDRYKTEQPFAGTDALFYQHQLGNQAPMTEAFFSLGLRPEKLTWIDIPYTSNESVRKHLGQKYDIPKEKFISCDDYKILAPYDSYQLERGIRFFHQLSQRKSKKLLVLDDGAYFLEVASCFAHMPDNVCIVEQTNRGFIKTAKNAAMNKIMSKLPLADVARSVLKSKIESPCIGSSVCASIAHHLGKRKDLATNPGDAFSLVLGYGNIGRSVIDFMIDELGYSRNRLYVWDPLKTNEIVQDGFNLWNRESDDLFDLVVGCSGTTSFDIGDYVFLNDRAILVSASSGAVEFNRRNIVEWANLNGSDDIEVTVDENSSAHPLHKDIIIKFPARNVTMLNGGFPINFDGRINCVASNHIQITMALMVLSAIQVVRAEKPGLIKPDYEVSRELVKQFYNQNSSELVWFPDEQEVLEELKNAYH